MNTFNTTKTALTDFTKMSLKNNNLQTEILLTTNASDAGVGTVIKQELKS